MVRVEGVPQDVELFRCQVVDAKLVIQGTVELSFGQNTIAILIKLLEGLHW